VSLRLYQFETGNSIALPIFKMAAVVVQYYFRFRTG